MPLLLRIRSIVALLGILSFLCFSSAHAQDTIPPAFDNGTILVLDAPWKFQPGDDPSYALRSYDDSSWDTLSTQFTTRFKGAEKFRGMGWFRMHLYTTQENYGKVLAFLITQNGASEIYFDGRKVQQWGKVGSGADNEERIDPQGSASGIYIDSAAHHVIAIRYSNFYSLGVPTKYEHDTPGFTATITDFSTATSKIGNLRTIGNFVLVFIFCFFFTVGLLHLLLYMHHRKERSNLYFSMFSIIMACLFFFPFLASNHTNPQVSSWSEFGLLLSTIAMCISLLALVYYLFYQRMLKIFWAFLILFILALAMIFSPFADLAALVLFFLVAITIIEVSRVVVIAMIRKKEGARIIGAGLMLFITCIFTLVIAAVINGGNLHLGGFGLAIVSIILCILSIPFSMSIYLARNFAMMNKNLQLQVVQIKDLSEQAIRQEQEKKRILESQNEMLEMQVAERTAEVVHQKREIEEKNKSITDSITYAKRIQQAILPHDEELNKLLPDSFVLYQPKDIVSGDFYWISRKGDHVFVAAADCTGHGVPGALMSMIGNALLNEIVNEKSITSPAAILRQLHTGIRQMLKQDQQHGETRDGMDMAICRLDMKTRELEYAGAMRPIYIVSGKELREIKADKYPIGGLQEAEKRKFTGHTLSLRQDDMIYMSSDGFADQFGGEKGKKFMVKKFQQLLTDIHGLPVQQQHSTIKRIFEEWKGNLEQVDDVLVIGIRIP